MTLDERRRIVPLATRAALLDRHFLEEGATSLLPGPPDRPDWRCDGHRSRSATLYARITLMTGRCG